MWVPLHRNRAAHVNPEAAFLPARFLRTDDTDDSDATDDSETSVLSVSSVPSVVQGRVRLEPPDTMKATCRRWKLTRHYCRDKALVPRHSNTVEPVRLYRAAQAHPEATFLPARFFCTDGTDGADTTDSSKQSVSSVSSVPSVVQEQARRAPADGIRAPCGQQGSRTTLLL